MNHLNMLNEVVNIAKEAAKIIEDSKLKAEFFLKSDQTYVSQVDINVERYISLALKSLDPNIPVFGEELGANGMSKHDRFWLIDPIDGTAWYRMGIPIYGSLISLIENGEPVIGCISLPGVNQFCYAAKGYGCFIETNSLAKTPVLIKKGETELNNAVVTASGIHGTNIWLENGEFPWKIDNVFKAAKLFKLSGDCIQHVQVACGTIDAAIDTIMKPWDSAALIICLKEAGAVVMDLHGNQDRLLYRGSLLSATSMPLALELIKELSCEN
ncbi:inositol monophosphatase family protein [Moritella viscosa]|uniref:Histidinol-phosphate phosphatase HisN n=1 Tax=Moritella viscosa TaxID=80854 RepID=A0A1K9ZNR2_9GAMM|nr:inositol monophosphatase [Moritella viscosa]SGZ00725.1 Histidinol-phosphate phosphatase HisN [Moritella viscosa]SHO14263.1 Histidinol-phosphate phosphatase HisN [Moritella viscosa]SHO14317.1 Histidinol-phosphate phosphatase HisN [Moritella viscosa]SHO18262.1 Histidinol-phosphate phosphatase HisN [Moritella viscosa]SHO18904.1 Histidinol-phosphate phosphatase HisN [Moritella viscosa]